MHGMRKIRYRQNIQKQIQFPTTRFSIPRGTSAKSLPLSRLSEGIFTAGQNEESHENRPRVLCAKGRLPTQPRYRWIFLNTASAPAATTHSTQTATSHHISSSS